MRKSAVFIRLVGSIPTSDIFIFLFIKSYLNKFFFLKGKIKSIRFQGFYIFFDLELNSNIIQVIFNKNKFNFEYLRVGCSINILGFFIFRNKININYFKKFGFFDFFLINFYTFNLLLIYNNIFFLNKYLFFKNQLLNFLINFLYIENFIYIETPILSKYSSEGSRVYIVPFRSKNLFFSLSQSPQIYKQILIIKQVLKYYQIAKCFRDEDFRSDRNNEFIQLDLEASFIFNLDIIFFLEKIFFCIIYFFFKFFNYRFSSIFYKNSSKIFNSDKPDLRFKINLSYNDYFLSLFFFFKKSKTFFNFINLYFFFGNNFKNYYFFLEKKKNFYYFFIFKKFFYINIFNIKNFINIFLFEFLILNKIDFYHIFFFNYFKLIYNNLNLYFIKKNIINNSFFFLWVLNFPLFKYNNYLKKYVYLTNPFSCIIEFDLIYLDLNPLKCLSKSYDLVINGIEIGGGSIRNEKSFLQKKIFLIVNNIYNVNYNFSFFINFLKKSPPDHGGVGIGLDRILMIISGLNNIKNISIFNKSNSGNCFFSKSPNLIL